MQMLSKEHMAKKIKGELLKKHVILTCGKTKVANIAIISDVIRIEDNEFLLGMTNKNVKLNESNVVYINKDDITFKLSFEIVSAYVSKNILDSYKLLSQIQIGIDFSTIQLTMFGSSLKTVRMSNTGGNFSNWYDSERITNDTIELFDGLWIGDKYIRILPFMSQSSPDEINFDLFVEKNCGKLFSQIGTMNGHITINGLVVPGIKDLLSITSDQVIFIDNNGKKRNIYYLEEVAENLTA